MSAPDEPGRKPPPRPAKPPAPARPPARGSGPVPVRDAVAKPAPEAAPHVEAEPAWEQVDRGFETEEGAWVVRGAGIGAYGTGRTGTARLMAVHFFREDDPETPVREALIAAGLFPHLRPEELRELFDRATPIPRDD